MLDLNGAWQLLIHGFFPGYPLTTPLHHHSPDPFNTLQFRESFTYFSLDEKNHPPGRKEATNFLCLHLVVVKSWNSNLFSVLQVYWCKVKLEFEIWKCHSSSWVMRSQHSGWGVRAQVIAQSEYTPENWTIFKTQSHGRCGVWVSSDFPLLKKCVISTASIPLVTPGCRNTPFSKFYIAIEIVIPHNEDDLFLLKLRKNSSQLS